MRIPNRRTMVCRRMNLHKLQDYVFRLRELKGGGDWLVCVLYSHSV